MILEKFSPDLFAFDPNFEYRQSVGNMKPRGLWVSVKGEDDWPAWAESEDFYWPDNFKHRYEVTLREDANVLFLETVGQIKAFHQKYKKALDPDSASRALAKERYIDWERVASDYDGIIIAPYQWSLRLEDSVFWYYGWDVASGCIWNLDVIDIEWKEQDWVERRDAAKALEEV